MKLEVSSPISDERGFRRTFWFDCGLSLAGLYRTGCYCAAGADCGGVVATSPTSRGKPGPTDLYPPRGNHDGDDRERLSLALDRPYPSMDGLDGAHVGRQPPGRSTGRLQLPG